MFGSHLPAYTSCLVAATGAAALVGADGVSIAEYQGNKQTKSTHHIQLSVADPGEGPGGTRTPPPPTHLSVKDSSSVQKRDLSLSFLVLPQHE